MASFKQTVITLVCSIFLAHGVLLANEPLDVFEQRIMPIFRSQKPSSCIQCHLSSVDLKDYIRPSHTETFLALREQGLVDIHQPKKSKILALIQMGDRDSDREATLIHEKTRRAEYDAFSAWIEVCCADKQFVAMKASDELPTVGSIKSLDVIRHTRKSSLVNSFTRQIWSQRMRCFPCHTPDEIDPKNPKHKVPAKRHADLVKQYGQRMNIFQATPEETLRRLIAASRKSHGEAYPLINLKEPAKSLLILKPISKLPKKNEDGEFEKPSSSDPVSHMGGLKMHRNDHSYKMFTRWIQDYANAVDGKYTAVDQLPADNWIPTKRIIRIKDVPESWGPSIETAIQLFVHRWDEEEKAWSKQPIAFTQGPIAPRRIVNGALILLRNRDNSESLASSDDRVPLSPGEYQIRVFADKSNNLSEYPDQLLEDVDYVGEFVIQAKWKVGFKFAEVFSANDIKQE